MSHPLPCFDYCLSLAKTYSIGGIFIVTLHHTGLACSDCCQNLQPAHFKACSRLTERTSGIIWLSTMSLVPFHPFSYLAVTAHLGLWLLQFWLGCLSLSLFWVWPLPLRCSCLLSPFYYRRLFLADCCSSRYSCCTLSSSVDAALQGYDSCCQLFLVWKGCHAFCFDLTILRSTLVFNRLYFLLHLGYNHFSRHRGRTLSHFQLH